MFIQMLSIAGFCLGAFVHIAMLIDLFEPPRLIILLLNIGSAAIIYVAIYISKQTRNKTNTPDIKEIILDVCPHWLLVFTGIMIMYSFAVLLYNLHGKYSGESLSGSRVQIKYSYGYWLGLYALSHLIIYSCRKYLQKRG